MTAGSAGRPRNRLDGRVAIVSGAGQGIGRALALGFAREGASVVIAEIDGDNALRVGSELKASRLRGLAIPTDVSQEASASAMVSEYGRVDVLVNLAGGSLHVKPIQEFPLEEWQEVIDANLKTTFLSCQAVIGIMTRQRHGAIVNPERLRMGWPSWPAMRAAIRRGTRCTSTAAS